MCILRSVKYTELADVPSIVTAVCRAVRNEGKYQFDTINPLRTPSDVTVRVFVMPASMLDFGDARRLCGQSAITWQ